MNNDGDGADLTADTVSVSSTGGNVGSESDPINVDADEFNAYGQNVNAESNGDLNIGTVVAEDTANLTASGDVTDTNTGVGVIADNANITAGGNIGTDDNPLDVNTDNLTTNSGGDTNLNLTSPSTNVDATAGGDVNITSTGAVQGTSTSQNLNIDADGDVGSASKPFVANLTDKDGTATANSNYGKVNLKTNYPKTEPKKDEKSPVKRPVISRSKASTPKVDIVAVLQDFSGKHQSPTNRPASGGSFNWTPVAIVALAALAALLFLIPFKRRRKDDEE